MNLTYEEIRIRRLARGAIKRRFPNGDISLMLKGVTLLEDAVVVEVNSPINADVLHSTFSANAYSVRVITEEEGSVQVRISR